MHYMVASKRCGQPSSGHDCHDRKRPGAGQQPGPLIRTAIGRLHDHRRPSLDDPLPDLGVAADRLSGTAAEAEKIGDTAEQSVLQQGAEIRWDRDLTARGPGERSTRPGGF